MSVLRISVLRQHGDQAVVARGRDVVCERITQLSNSNREFESRYSKRLRIRRNLTAFEVDILHNFRMPLELHTLKESHPNKRHGNAADLFSKLPDLPRPAADRAVSIEVTDGIQVPWFNRPSFSYFRCRR
jgi:hypothetical protein